VLDTAHGRPAAGMALELAQLAADGTRLVLARTMTNADGRTDAPLLADRPLPIAQYELLFDVAAYFAATDAAVADPPFLTQVPLRFAIAEPEGHYHVPLLVSPWAYSTYRGS
jgi:2-oxo-4-hydroxy-4-carboxy-5-ureidoimidazoline decarboxylase